MMSDDRMACVTGVLWWLSIRCFTALLISLPLPLPLVPGLVSQGGGPSFLGQQAGQPSPMSQVCLCEGEARRGAVTGRLVLCGGSSIPEAGGFEFSLLRLKDSAGLLLLTGTAPLSSPPSGAALHQPCGVCPITPTKRQGPGSCSFSIGALGEPESTPTPDKRGLGRCVFSGGAALPPKRPRNLLLGSGQTQRCVPKEIDSMAKSLRLPHTAPQRAPGTKGHQKFALRPRQ